MASRPPTLQEASDSYYPKGIHESPALKRARLPYQIRNVLTGGGIVAFIVGVYFYSISAVKQDDFSDVVDLLPPPEERAKMRSIEDELRDKELGVAPIASELPKPATPVSGGTGVMAWLPKRLDQVEWLHRRGWVETGKGNVIVWGAPNVDNIGNMRDSFPSAGPRRV
ncbi:putative mitochondrion protein [Cutaneotrichosporon oleaginosum]|uniref:Cytochrome c oxidase assembly factor 3 n=1 Tax=Cutaneotrichosporon oleaginosum TaxID=879819 RepID=A0A0J0XM35_9TREE|nr:putative mitochondrion protein [Cutaneotrichosporon oleaginosum]KLT42176.1 putative mitochondrion protein [Cutaneotrichosporon oleaginosum]